MIESGIYKYVDESGNEKLFMYRKKTHFGEWVVWEYGEDKQYKDPCYLYL